MIAAWLSDAIPGLCVLAFFYLLGGIHGVGLAWTNEARFRRYADRVAGLYERAAAAVDEVASGPGERGRGPSGVPPLTGTDSTSSTSDTAVS